MITIVIINGEHLKVTLVMVVIMTTTATSIIIILTIHT